MWVLIERGVDLANGSFGSCTGWVKFGSGHVRVKRHFRSFRFGSAMVQFGSILGQLILVKYALHCKTSNFVENFGSGMVQFGLIQVSGPLSGEHISGVESGMGPGQSVRVSSLESIFPGPGGEYRGVGLSKKIGYPDSAVLNPDLVRLGRGPAPKIRTLLQPVTGLGHEC